MRRASPSRTWESLAFAARSLAQRPKHRRITPCWSSASKTLIRLIAFHTWFAIRSVAWRAPQPGTPAQPFQGATAPLEKLFRTPGSAI